MSDPLFISDIIKEIENGSIRIPSFQRGFVWEVDRVAHLMDSIYKGYPFGSILVWRTKTPLTTERKLGPYELPKQSPDYPLDYILDGQQRITSIFGVFQNTFSAKSKEEEDVFKMYFDLTSDDNIQDCQFMYVPDEEVDKNKHFPLRILFNPPEYRKFTRELNEEICQKVDKLYDTFTKAKIPEQVFKTDDRASVAIVFERINRLGVELDTLQLLCAWTWSEDFDLQEKFKQLEDELEPFGFNQIGEDSDLLLKCFAANIVGDASLTSVIELNGNEVRAKFDEIKNGILSAIDFLKTNLNVYSLKVLPYRNLIIPLSVFFASQKSQKIVPSSEQHETLIVYIWRTLFSRRYSRRLEQLNRDLKEIIKLKNNEENKLIDFEVNLKEEFFNANNFSLKNVDTKTFILMLANANPLNFTDGSKIGLEPVLRECNRKEFHHIYPKAFLKNTGVDAKKINCLANLCILARAVNNKISDRKPSEYKLLMPEDLIKINEIMDGCLCPHDIFHDNYDKFISERTQLLLDYAKELINLK